MEREREREIGTSKKKKSSYLRSLGVWLTWSYVSLGSFRKGTRTRRHLLLVYNHLRSARFVLVSLGYGGPSPERVRLLLAIRHGKQIRRIWVTHRSSLRVPRVYARGAKRGPVRERDKV